MIIRKTANFTDVKLNSLKQRHNASAYTWARKQRTFDVAPFDRTNSSWKAFIDTNTTRIVIPPVCCKYNNVGLNQSSKKTKSSKNRRIGLKTIYSPNEHPRIPTFQTGAEKGEGRGRREKRLKRRNRVFNSLVFQLPATGRERGKKCPRSWRCNNFEKKDRNFGYFVSIKRLPSSSLSFKFQLGRGETYSGRTSEKDESGWIRSKHVLRS